MKAGIEIHQRLNTKKLFCRCSSSMGGNVYGAITRKLRAVSGELGLTDQSTIYEYLRDRKFVYKVYEGTSCLVDQDEEPPHHVDKEALDIALQVAKFLKCDIPDEIHVMRKTVIDGSNTSGFQRTAIVGMNGVLETSFGDVSIDNVSLEEESSQILDRKGGLAVYGLDRLGIPLVEIGTGPDMKTPDQVREVAEKIGMLLRSTGRVKRGLGTIRQDVNVSVEGGTRVEVKGAQDLRIMQEIVKNEADRQENLLKIKNTLSQRDVSFSDAKDVTGTFKNTKNRILREGIDSGKRVFAFTLGGFGGLMKTKISSEKTFGKELAEYAMSRGTKGMMHSDEDISKYDLTREFSTLTDDLDMASDDVVCVIVANEEDGIRACDAVIERAKLCLDGVPKETRAPNQDGTSSFMRPLPGGQRMYPETDIPYIVINRDYLDSIPLPETLESRKARYVSLGLGGMADEMLKSERLGLFERHLDKSYVPKIAELLTAQMTALRREGVDVDSIKDSDLDNLIENLDDVPKESVPDLLRELAAGRSFDEALKDMDLVSEDDAERVIKKIVEENAAMIEEKGERAFPIVMGEAMKELRGKISGETISRIVKESLDLD